MDDAVLLTGGTGFLGTLIAGVLFGREKRPVVALVRKGWRLEALATQIARELGRAPTRHDLERLLAQLTVLPYPERNGVTALARQLERFHVGEIVHSAGSVDYLNSAELEETNIRLTDTMLELSRAIGINRFIHISTAYSSGYVAGPIEERLHDEPDGDPTPYTRTKRVAEWHVGESGLPYLILRPSVVIGDSRTGRYSGKATGLYQCWRGWERLLLDHGCTDIHMVAPALPVNFVHQDSFQNAFHAAYRSAASGTVINLISDPAKAPTVRHIFDLWLAALGSRRRCYYYDRLKDVPLDRVSSRHRAFLSMVAINLEISAHRWDFENGTMRRLKQEGIDFTDSTLDTIAVCQARFLKESPRIRAAIAQTAPDAAQPIFA